MIYVYECRRCGKFDAEQRITADALTECPVCGDVVRRLITRTAFVLKGRGWAKDGYGGVGGGGRLKS